MRQRSASRADQRLTHRANPHRSMVRHAANHWDWGQVGYTSLNRKPSILYIHNTLCRNVSQNGHDNGRPRIGVAIHFTSQKGKERLVKDPLSPFIGPPPPTTSQPILKPGR